MCFLIRLDTSVSKNELILCYLQALIFLNFLCLLTIFQRLTIFKKIFQDYQLSDSLFAKVISRGRE